LFRIAVIGSQCTGKSSVAEALAEKLKLPRISEVARKFDKSMFVNKTNKEFCNLQHQILSMQLKEEAKYKEFVSDRSTIDNMAYWVHNCANIATTEENSLYVSKALGNVKNYTHLFLLVPEFYPVDDGFRDTNIVYQLQIAEAIHTILHMNSIKHHTLRGTLENRLKDALNILKVT